MRATRPAWVNVNLDHLAHNIKEVRRVTRAESQVMAVIKADGYGHGASQIAATLKRNGADRFAVATLSEAIRLRHSDQTTPILILGYTPSDLAERLIEHQLTQTIYTVQQAKAFNAIAQANGQRIRVHIKVDTGMARLGFLWDEQLADLLSCFEYPHLDIEGLYTHFACADEADKTLTHLQVKRYQSVVSAIEAKGYTVPIKHVSNSAGIIDLPEYNFDMVRAGIMLYGLYPSAEVDKQAVALKEVMSLKARVAHVKQLPAGSGVSYGHIYHTSAPSTIASLPLGYADGFTRLLTGKGNVLFKGERLPIVGRICMDQCMVLGNAALAPDSEVTLFGYEGTQHKSIDEVAQAIGTINYEVVCMIDKRLPRHYYREGVCVQQVDALLDLAAVSY